MEVFSSIGLRETALTVLGGLTLAFTIFLADMILKTHSNTDKITVMSADIEKIRKKTESAHNELGKIKLAIVVSEYPTKPGISLSDKKAIVSQLLLTEILIN